MTLRDVHIRCAPKPGQYPDSAISYINECAAALDELAVDKYDFITRVAPIPPKVISKMNPPSKQTAITFVRETINSSVPYILGMLLTIAITVALYFPAAVALFFITGAYVSKVTLHLNNRLGIMNSAYIKAILIACSGLALETIILLIAKQI